MFLDIDHVNYIAVYVRVRELSEFIKNILTCVPKMKEGLTGLERHPFAYCFRNVLSFKWCLICAKQQFEVKMSWWISYKHTVLHFRSHSLISGVDYCVFISCLDSYSDGTHSLLSKQISPKLFWWRNKLLYLNLSYCSCSNLNNIYLFWTVHKERARGHQECRFWPWHL